MRLNAAIALCATLLFSACASERIIGGGSLRAFSKRTSLPHEAVVSITHYVEMRLGRGGVFWDGPYSPDEAARIVRLSEEKRPSFGAFSARHIDERFFVCFQFCVLDGFTAHGSERTSGYMPDSIFVVGTTGAVEWYDLGRANQALVPTTAAVTPAADASVAPAAVAAHL
jgi:hypothetical protein